MLTYAELLERQLAAPPEHRTRQQQIRDLEQQLAKLRADKPQLRLVEAG